MLATYTCVFAGYYIIVQYYCYGMHAIFLMQIDAYIMYIFMYIYLDVYKCIYTCICIHVHVYS